MAWVGEYGQVLPNAGEAFLVPIAPGRYTFAWVVGPHGERNHLGTKVFDIRIACAVWTGSAAPTKAELDARKVRRLIDAKGKDWGPLVLAASTPPPKNWQRVGVVKRPWVDPPPLWHGDWHSISHYASTMWLREHDPKGLATRDAVDPEDAAEERALAKRVLTRKQATLAQLARADLLPEWDGLTTKRRKTTVERWLRACVTELLTLAPNATRSDKLRVIESTVEKINHWRGSSGIDTPEREALCTAIDDIGHAVGLRGHDLAGPWRDW